MSIHAFRRTVPVPVLAVVMAFALMGSVSAAQRSTPSFPHVPNDFTIERIASVESARELAVAPNGDLFVGTLGNDVYVVPHAQNAQPDAAHVYAHLPDAPAAGVAFGGNTLFIGTQFGVYRLAYRSGDVASAPQHVTSVRVSGESRGHMTTTLAVNGTTLYASIGSSCNACTPELDATRATIQRIDLASSRMLPVAVHIRNAIALAVNPTTGTLWAGVAGVDDLPAGFPYEIFDAITLHDGVADYGWPSCYNARRPDSHWPGDCSRTAIPRVAFPAYETPIGAVFYPRDPNGRYAFPARYRGGAFVTLHGSWHGPPQGLPGYVPPRVVFVPMRGDTPATPVDWNDPTMQWSVFADGYQLGGTIRRSGRPSGIAVSPDGSLFIADDLNGSIYRIRPKGS